VNRQRRDRNWIYEHDGNGRRRDWAQIPYVLNYAMPPDLVYFLGVLMDWDRRKSEASNSGWFYLPSRTIWLNFPFITRRVEERIFRQLREPGFVHTRMSGGRGTTHRWISVDYSAIAAACRRGLSAVGNNNPE
jgi:hypothetical protein